jgi:hypothetical protein
VGADSTAIVGSGVLDGDLVTGDSDLAAALGDMLGATATGGNSLIDILPSI